MRKIVCNACGKEGQKCETVREVYNCPNNSKSKKKKNV